jgi:hypothetical protein
MAKLDVFFSDFAVVEGGGIRHEPGSVHAYFRNGGFTHIVKQKQFAIPVLRRTLLGHIEVVSISTASHEISVEIPDVVTADRFVHPSVAVQLLVRLNDSDDYKLVANLLTQHGRKAGEVLSAGISASIERQIRASFLQWYSEDLLTKALDEVVHVDLHSLADGVVEVARITGFTWTKAAAFTQILETQAHAATLELTHEVAIIEQDHQLKLDRRNTEHEVVMGRLRADDDEITRQREHDRTKELATIQGMSEIAAKFFESGRANSKDFEKLMGAMAPQLPSAPADSWQAPLAARVPLAIDVSGLTAEHTPMAADVPTLNVEARLKKLWLAEGLPDALAGCASSASGGNVGAVFVLAGAMLATPAVDEMRPLERSLLNAYRAESARLIVLPLLGSRQRLIENYLAEAVKYVASMLDSDLAGEFSLELADSSDDELTVRVTGQRAAEVRRVLSDPASCLLSPLVSLLALDFADVVLG